MHAGRIAALGTPVSLKQELGPNATLDDVFVNVAGISLDQGGSFRDAINTRRTATRLS
jgi:ABC-2 type transport system ATP-binding protein